MLATDREPGPDDLTEAQRGLLDAVAAGKLAWTSVADLLAAGHTAETLASLEAAGWVVRWPIDPEAVTLTPWGAWESGLSIVERWRVETVERVEHQGAGRAPRRVKERTAMEAPVWHRAGRDEHGDPIRPDHDELPPPPVYCKTGALPVYDRLELFADPAPGPLDELLMREAWDEEQARPVIDLKTGRPKLVPLLLLGRTIKIDKRLTKRSGKNREASRARTG